MDLLVGLRHDVDTSLGLSRGVPLILSIEERLGIRSSFYVRVALLRSEEQVRMLRWAEARGWEIGLHLDHTYELGKALAELDKLRSLGFRVMGVTIHGGLYGMMGESTWRIIDGLGLAYAHAGNPPSWVKTLVLPGHYTLDYYVGRYGEAEGLRRLIHDLAEGLKRMGSVVLSSHPEYFVVSAGSTPVLESRLSPRARALKMLRRASIVFLTLLGRRKVSGLYEALLRGLGKHVDLVPLIDMCRLLYGSSCPA